MESISAQAQPPTKPIESDTDEENPHSSAAPISSNLSGGTSELDPFEDSTDRELELDHISQGDTSARTPITRADPGYWLNSLGTLFIGGSIAILTLLVPLASVVRDRTHFGLKYTFPSPNTPIYDGPQQSGRLSGTRSGQHHSRDSSRKHE